jgi:ribosome-binding protein aMBF1 (putative translation factor)
MATNKVNGNKLTELSKQNPPSSWREMELYKKENRKWQKKSLDIALRVLDELEEKGMTQMDLARKLNISRQQVSKILKGRENFTLETVTNLEEVLGIELMKTLDKCETSSN